MIISINQPAYLPWLGYFNRIYKSDLHVILDNVQFEKNSFINRNKILINDTATWLTIPVLTKNLFGHLAINTIQIDNKSNWRKKHFLSIQQAYSKCPHWTGIKSFLETYYTSNHTKLIELLKLNLNFFFNYLQIETQIVYASDYQFKSSKSDLILEICNQFGGSKYISGSLGRNYLDINKFQEKGIEIEFDDYTHPYYDQKNEKFVSNLSVIDILARFGKQSWDVIKNV